MVPRWIEVTVEIPKECSDAVANFLIDNGAPGLELEEGDGSVALIAYFRDTPPLEPLRGFCAAIGVPLPSTAMRIREIAEEDWAQNWKLHFQPQLIGERLYICPPWDTATPLNRIVVVIDPGMAFGTGQHASTRGCLRLLDWATASRPFHRALDIGTGSGILAIALAKLGAREVWAVDTDPQALVIACVNASRNGVDERIRFASNAGDPPGKFDLVVANLFANLLHELAGRLSGLVASGGTLICSGLLVEDEHPVRCAYESRGFEAYRRDEESGWLTLALRRNTL